MGRGSGAPAQAIALTFTVRFRRTAELDVQEAQSWYEEQQAGLAEDFNREVDPFPGLVSGLGFFRSGVGLHAWVAV